MPLRITAMDKGGLSTLNKWAEGQETQVNAHTKQIQQLQQVIQHLVESLKGTGLSV